MTLFPPPTVSQRSFSAKHVVSPKASLPQLQPSLSALAWASNKNPSSPQQKRKPCKRVFEGHARKSSRARLVRKVDAFFTNENQRFSDFRELPNLGSFHGTWIETQPAAWRWHRMDGYLKMEGLPVNCRPNTNTTKKWTHHKMYVTVCNTLYM